MIDWIKPLKTKNGRHAYLASTYYTEGRIKHRLVCVRYSEVHETHYEYNEDGTFPSENARMLDLENV